MLATRYCACALRTVLRVASSVPFSVPTHVAGAPTGDSPTSYANASQKPITALETARGWGGMEYAFRS